ncbi:MAG: hypothetical protein Q8M54_02900 [Desulfobaccales bacterium]|nr:hypothetical protein [Desulfobaccales bacterium]
MLEVLLTIGGAILGFSLGTIYEKFKGGRLLLYMRIILERELRSNIGKLNELLEILDGPLPSPIMENYQFLK